MTHSVRLATAAQVAKLAAIILDEMGSHVNENEERRDGGSEYL